MRSSTLVLALILSVLIVVPASANSVGSGTIEFEGTLTDAGSGVYTGTIDATEGSWYVAGGGGAGISVAGGFDVYAKEGGCALVQGYYGTGAWNCSGLDTYTIGHDTYDDHDAYPDNFGSPPPWGDFWNPDVPDYYNYELLLTVDGWALQFKEQYHGTPMSGRMDWTNMYAAETDIGSYTGTVPADPDANDGDAFAHGAGAGWWDMDWTWGTDAIPLELAGFDVTIDDLGGDLYHVTLTPADPTEVWVDDDFTDATPGWGVTHFASIGDAVAAVGDGGTIRISAGTYAQGVNLSPGHDLTFAGAGRDLVTWIAPPADECIHCDMTGYTGAMFYEIYGITFDCRSEAATTHGTGIMLTSAISGPLSLDIHDCRFVEDRASGDGDHWASSMWICHNRYAARDGLGNAPVHIHDNIDETWGGVTMSNCQAYDIHDNVFDGCTDALYNGHGCPDVAGQTFGDHHIYANTFKNASDLLHPGGDHDPSIAWFYYGAGGGTHLPSVIENNIFQDNDAAIVFAMDTDMTYPAHVLSNNSFVNNGLALQVMGTYATTIDASANWWDSADPAAVAGVIEGPVDYSPWLGTGADVADPGFYGDYSILWVDDDSDQTGSAGLIGEAIGLVSGSTVNVAAGTYVEQVTIEKSLSLLGAGSTTTTIQAPATGRALITEGTYDWDYVVAADGDGTPIDVRIGGFTIDANGEDGDGTLCLAGVFLRDVGDGIDDGVYNCVVDNFGTYYGGWAGAPYNTFTGNSGVVMYGMCKLALDGNDIADYTVQGIAARGAGSQYVVSGNDLDGTDANYAGLYVRDASASVTGNTVYDHPCIGIFLYEPAASGIDVTSGNTLTDNDVGVSMKGVVGSDIIGNTITGCTERAIIIQQDSDGNTVENNVIAVSSGDATGAIVIGSDSGGNTIGPDNAITVATSGGGLLYSVHIATPGDNTITGNTIVGGKRGVQIDGGSTGTTTITGNHISNGGPVDNMTYGIGANAGDLVITGNTLLNTVRPVEFFGVHDVTMTSNVLNGSNYFGVNCGSFSGAVAINNCSFLSINGNAISNQTTTVVDGELNWWGSATGPTHSGNPGGVGEPSTDYVDYDPWIGKAGAENVVFYPELLELNEAAQGGPMAVKYLGGASDLLYGFSITFTWDPTKVSMDGVSMGDIFPGVLWTDFTFLYYGGVGTHTIDCTRLGAATGVTGPGTLFTINLSAVGCGSDDITITSILFRDSGNQPLSGVYARNGAISIDTEIPALATLTVDNLDNPYFNDYAKNGDDLVIEATVTDACGALDDVTVEANLSMLLLTGGGLAVAPTIYSSGTATWNLNDVDLTGDGPKVITVTVTDLLGNSSYDEIMVNVDNTSPLAVTDLVAAPGHNKAELTWTDSPATYDDNFHEYVVRSHAWGDAGYPTYPALGVPDYPANAGDGDLVNENVTDGSYTAIYAPDNSERSILYYGVFARDKAGNYGPAGTGDRCTNYWLGDVARESDNEWIPEGRVFDADIAKLSGTYGGAPSGSFLTCDVGPTDDHSRVGIPVPEGFVNFEDLMIFAMNYGVVAPRIVPFLTEPGIGDLVLALSEAGRSNDGVLTLALRLEGNLGDVKGLSAELEFDGLEFLSARLSDEMSAPVAEVFFWSDAASRSTQVDVAVLGTDVTIGGSGDVALLTFQIVDEAYTVDFTSAALRGAANDELTADFEGLSHDGVPASFKLVQNTPNPFNPVTTVGYHLPSESRVTIRIFDVTGRLVTTLVDEVVEPGRHTVAWNGTSEYGESVGSGVYFCTMETPEYRGSHKMTLLK